ncbi:MAG: 30S ribosomal protein THX [Rhodanobacteraceae bacterium]|nr:30S ribosomal protein THX [Rhodanobacteraceae bacterium]
MGKGDRKTRKGKTYSGSYGNVRPHAVKTDAATKTVSKTAAKKAAPVAKKPAAKKPAA